jgi:hypothetical protein
MDRRDANGGGNANDTLLSEAQPSRSSSTSRRQRGVTVFLKSKAKMLSARSRLAATSYTYSLSSMIPLTDLTQSMLPDYLADVNEQAEEMLSQLVNQMAKDEGVDEAFKRRDQLDWVQRMNSIRNRAEEVVLNEIIYQ